MLFCSDNKNGYKTLRSKLFANGGGGGNGGGNSTDISGALGSGRGAMSQSMGGGSGGKSTGNYSGAATGYGKSGYGPVSAGKPGVYGGGVWGGRAATTAELASDRRSRVAKQIADAKKTKGIVDRSRIPSMGMEDRLSAKGILSGMATTRTNPKAMNNAFRDLTKDMGWMEKAGLAKDVYLDSMPGALKAGLAISQFPTGLAVTIASVGAALTGNLVSEESNLKDFGEKSSGSMPNSSALSDNDLRDIAGNAKAEAQQSGGVPSKMLEQINYIREL